MSRSSDYERQTRVMSGAVHKVMIRSSDYGWSNSGNVRSCDKKIDAVGDRRHVSGAVTTGEKPRIMSGAVTVDHSNVYKLKLPRGRGCPRSQLRPPTRRVRPEREYTWWLWFCIG